MSIIPLLFALAHTGSTRYRGLYNSGSTYTVTHNIAKVHKAAEEGRLYRCKHCGASYVLEHGQSIPRYCIECGTLFDSHKEVKS